jgi:hypothetical protein
MRYINTRDAMFHPPMGIILYFSVLPLLTFIVVHYLWAKGLENIQRVSFTVSLLFNESNVSEAILFLWGEGFDFVK